VDDDDGVGGVVRDYDGDEGGRQQDDDRTVGYGMVVTSTVLASRRNSIYWDRLLTGIHVFVVPLHKKKTDRPGQHNVDDVYGGSVVLAMTAKKNRQDTTKLHRCTDQKNH